MDNHSIYSVVDIETTGTDPNSDDRIIQFSCYQVQDNQIINEFTTDVNPQQTLSPRITQLTGIDQTRVNTAQSFDSLAGTIYKLLSGTIFVAHNVNFDFPFLNSEFQRVGYPELDLTAIDTVTLSQLLLPTLTSYRLSDMSKYFNIFHDHPHSANGDAYATARLLIVLFKQLQALPAMTLSQIVRLNPKLPLDTLMVLQQRDSKNRSQATAPKLADYLHIVDGLVLRNKELIEKSVQHSEFEFPKNKRQKKKLLPDNMESRPQQNTMMNMIYNNYAESSHREPKNLIIEAPTGIGKSLGYCLPFAYLAGDRQVVISTATNYLQQQLKDQTIPMINESLPFKTSTVIMKGSSHYIDLSRFKQLLYNAEAHPHNVFLKAQILIWLTMTKTGDLDELHLNGEQNSLLESINHRSIHELSKSNPFYEDDFLRFNIQNSKRANFLIVNHNYLLSNWQSFAKMTEKPYLCIDETHQFLDVVRTENKQRIVLGNLLADFDRSSMGLRYSLTDELFNNNQTLNNLKQKIVWLLSSTRASVNETFSTIFSQVIANASYKRANTELSVNIDAHNRTGYLDLLTNLKNEIEPQIKKLGKLSKKLQRELKVNSQTTAESDKQMIDNWLNQLTKLITGLSDLAVMINLYINHFDEQVFWITVKDISNYESLAFNWALFETNRYLQNTVYDHFIQPTFTGATIFSSRKAKYIFDTLGLDRSETVSKRLKNDFKDTTNAKMFLVNNFADDKQVNSDEYFKYLGNSIQRIYKNSPRQTMVLFNSLEAIRKTYHFMAEDGFTENHNVLAQGVNGTANKISRTFGQQEPAILLGTGTFWSGVDFPGDLLETLIIAQLPFDVPTDPYNSALYQRARANKQNPFYSISLPNATLKMRQGIGRLLRTKDDVGTVFVLDSRIVSKHYGTIMMANMDSTIPVETGSLDESILRMLSFYEKR
ncbi:helicase C-terminal domain-containing protein [Lentilactobacillus sp. SPB1-3]|uniref:Helicase C-terminal domain-containing protein n=1 Tax=Lentilactobacillus terminaliae TaxID=3003483 RepID=A0ACD5DCJ8_9LACO|nr:helicase C-terminal domain-containing protein [Lentilactobacillus sp. SPB1-3]MCZ0977225.1 exonuclease domain-containing protein [Lentilactobacillus sp. SPB1-3]